MTAERHLMNERLKCISARCRSFGREIITFWNRNQGESFALILAEIVSVRVRKNLE